MLAGSTQWFWSKPLGQLSPLVPSSRMFHSSVLLLTPLTQFTSLEEGLKRKKPQLWQLLETDKSSLRKLVPTLPSWYLLREELPTGPALWSLRKERFLLRRPSSQCSWATNAIQYPQPLTSWNFCHSLFSTWVGPAIDAKWISCQTSSQTTIFLKLIRIREMTDGRSTHGPSEMPFSKLEALSHATFPWDKKCSMKPTCNRRMEPLFHSQLSAQPLLQSLKWHKSRRTDTSHWKTKRHHWDTA